MAPTKWLSKVLGTLYENQSVAASSNVCHTGVKI